MCTYTETWSVPSNDPASIAFYETIFLSYLFNISNTSIANSSIESNTAVQFRERGEELADDRERRRLQQSSNDYSFVDWRQPFDLVQLYPERLVSNPLTPEVSQHLYNIIDCGLEKGDEMAEAGRPFGIHGDRLIRLKITFLSESDRGRFACLTLTTRNAMRYILAPFGMTPCRDRAYVCRGNLEAIPAPSPPPPDNWSEPPSPPAFAYETLTLATATGSSALFFVISAVCCLGIGGRTVRARQNSRMVGTGDQRVDRMPYLRERYQQHGEEPTGPFRPNLQQPGARLAPTNSAFSFSGLAARYNQVDVGESL